jgi:uncharacterized protein YybS (DUF2232 family)
MASAPASPGTPSLRRIGPAAAGFLSLAAFASLPFVPLLGAFIALLAPLPLVHMLACGRSPFLGWGWVTVALTGAALAAPSPWLVGACAGYVLVAVVPAVAVEWWLRTRWSSGRFVALVTLAALAFSCAVLTAIAAPAAAADAIAAALADATKGSAELVRALGGSGGGSEELFAWMVRQTAYFLPALAAIYVTGGVLWLRGRLPHLGLPLGREPFAFYRSEEWLPVGFVAGALGWVFLQEPVKWLAGNLLATVGGLYLVGGLAIIHFYLGPRLSASRWVRALLVVLTLQIPVALAAAALGLADTFVRLRRGGAWDGGE